MMQKKNQMWWKMSSRIYPCWPEHTPLQSCAQKLHPCGLASLSLLLASLFETPLVKSIFYPSLALVHTENQNQKFKKLLSCILLAQVTDVYVVSTLWIMHTSTKFHPMAYTPFWFLKNRVRHTKSYVKHKQANKICLRLQGQAFKN